MKLDKKIFAKNYLFWDVARKNIDLRKHKKFIIGRIMDKGDLDDYRLAVNYYGVDEIKKNIKNRNLNNKSLNFWCLIFNLNKEICARRQSIKKQSMFWRR